VLSWKVTGKPCRFSISTVALLFEIRKSSEPVLNQTVFRPFFNWGAPSAARWFFSQAAASPPRVIADRQYRAQDDLDLVMLREFSHRHDVFLDHLGCYRSGIPGDCRIAAPQSR